MIPGYAELHCVTCYSFLRGASDPEELVHRAAQLGYRALAITDECSVAGVVRAHVAAKDANLKLIVGTELTLADGMKLVLLVSSIAGYETLCELITQARRAAPKGEYRLSREDLPFAPAGLQAVWIPPPKVVPDTTFQAEWIANRFPGNAWIAIELHRGADDARRIEEIEAIGVRVGLTCVAAGDVHMHERARKKLQDVMSAESCSPTASATCAPSGGFPRSTRRACWPPRSTSPRAAPSRWTRSATNIPRSSCPRRKRPPRICTRSR